MYQDISIQTTYKPQKKPLKDRDDVYKEIKNEAYQLFIKHQPPINIDDWKKEKNDIYKKIIENTNFNFYKHLPLNISITKIINKENFIIQNIYFQTLPNIYSTANIYIPKGSGPFPAVINIHGHIKDGRRNISVNKRAELLASNGYICLCMDSFGSGERSETHGESDYHGANKGASLLNINETLLGLQISENIRCIDLLFSLNIVDKKNIGVTGESGGGSQAMWLAAIDERVKAAMPVVSVGTFNAFVMEHNCVCELLPNGLTFCEEFQVLGLIAPRALKICSALQEHHAAFNVEEMLKTAVNTGKIYELYNADSLINFQIFNHSHEFSSEIEIEMIYWFNKVLKNENQQINISYPKSHTDKDSLMVFEHGKRDQKIITQSLYLKKRSHEIYSDVLNKIGTPKEEISELKKILNITKKDLLIRYSIYTKKLNNIKFSEKIIIDFNPSKKYVKEVQKQELYDESINTIKLNLFGTGYYKSTVATYFDEQLVQFHTLARSYFWIGKSIIREWIIQIKVTVDYILKIKPNSDIILKTTKEAGIAAILYSVIWPDKIKIIEIENTPVSYLCKGDNKFDYYNMSIHLKGIINWGDIVRAMALSNTNFILTRPRNIHGKILTKKEKENFIQTYTDLKKIFKSNSKITLK